MKLRFKWISGAKTLCYSSDGKAWFAVPSDDPPSPFVPLGEERNADGVKVIGRPYQLDAKSLAARASMDVMAAAAAKLDAQPVPTRGRRMWDPKTDKVVPVLSPAPRARARGLGPKGPSVLDEISPRKRSSSGANKRR